MSNKDHLKRQSEELEKELKNLRKKIKAEKEKEKLYAKLYNITGTNFQNFEKKDTFEPEPLKLNENEENSSPAVHTHIISDKEQISSAFEPVRAPVFFSREVEPPAAVDLAEPVVDQDTPPVVDVTSAIEEERKKRIEQFFKTENQEVEESNIDDQKAEGYFSLFWKNKWKIAIFMFIFVSMFVFLSFLGAYYKSKMVLTISYPGSQKGLNPDGTRFNMFELESDEVLNLAIEKSGLTNLTAEHLKSRVDIYARTPVDIISKITNATVEGKDYYYIPNEFSISYSQKNKLSRNNSIKMLNAIADSYTEVFIKNHTEKNTILSEPIGDVSNYEFVEIADLYTAKIQQMEKYLRIRSSENATFRSEATGQTFDNLLEMLSNLRAIEVEKLKGFVVSSGLAKNKDLYIQKLNYTNKMLSYDHQKAKNAKDFTLNAISKYDPSITGVAFIPSIDLQNEFYMNRTKIGIDYLVFDAYKNGLTVETIAKQMNANSKLVEVFSGTVVTPEQNAQLTKTAKTMIDELDTKLNQISAVAVKTDDEYLSYKMRDYLKFNIPKAPAFARADMSQILLVAFIALLIGCGYILFMEMIKQRRAK